MNQIKLVQNPVIEHQFIEAGEKVALRIKELNLESQVATSETIQTLKSLRAELNKEKAAIDKDVKLVLSPVSDAITSVKDSYKLNIKDKYDEAESILKDKIGVFETNVKTDKENELKDYFKQLVESYDIDFLKFENLNLTINLSTTLKKYQQQCIDYVNKIVEDLELIETQEYKAEILAEFKTSLNVSNAIKSVTERNEAIKREQEAIKEKLYKSRVNELLSIGLELNEMTKIYCFCETPIVYDSELKEMAKNDFTESIEKALKIIEDSKPKEETKEVLKAPEKVVNKPTPEVAKEPVKTTIKEVKKEVSQEPKEEKELSKETVVKAKFEAVGTMKQLKSIAAFMRENNIKYVNL